MTLGCGLKFKYLKGTIERAQKNADLPALVPEERRKTETLVGTIVSRRLIVKREMCDCM